MKKLSTSMIAAGLLTFSIGTVCFGAGTTEAPSPAPGKVSIQTQDKAAAYWSNRFKNKLDTNKDGKLSIDEHRVNGKIIFDEIDINKDGSVTLVEYTIYLSGEKTPAKANANPIDPQKANFIKSADTNGDGIVSIDEMLVFCKKRFIHSDKNNDGKLSTGELQDGFIVNFKNADKNGDDILTEDEFVAYWSGIEKPNTPVKPAKPAAK